MEEGLNDEIDAYDEEDEVDTDLSSPTDDDDLAWVVSPMNTDEEELLEDFKLIEVDDNLDLKDTDFSSYGIIGKPRRALINDEFVAPNKGLNTPPPTHTHFANASGKKQIALHQVFKDHIEFNEPLKDYAVEKGFKFYKMKNSKAKVCLKCKVNDCP